MIRRLSGIAAVVTMFSFGWVVLPQGGAAVGQAQIGLAVYSLSQDEVSAAFIGGTLTGAAAYAGGEAGAKIGGFLGGIVGAAVGGALGAL